MPDQSARHKKWFVLAVVLAIGPIGWAALIFGLPAWTLGTSLFVLLQRPERAAAVAAAA